LDAALGFALLGLTLYTSTLAYALRTYSRSRLAGLLPEKHHVLWFERLDQFEAEMQVIASAARLVCVLGLVAFVHAKAPAWRGDLTWLSDFVFANIICVIALILLAVGVPHSISNHAGEWFLKHNLRVIWTVRLLAMPLEKMLAGLDFIVRRLLGIHDADPERQSERHEQEILDAVSEGELHGAVDEDQKEMIESVFELSETPVSAIMTPRTDMVALAVDATAEQVRKTIVEAGHSRVPIFEHTLDQIIGVLYAKDLLGLADGREIDIRQLMRAVPYVPESRTIDKLLRDLRQQRVHIAIVLDEYGGTAGLVTIEDIIEEVVGEIDDEYDPETPPEMLRIDADTLEVDARMHVDEINEELDVEIPEDGDYDTIGGFVFSALGKIPIAGESVDHQNIHIDVLDAEPRKINRLRVTVARRAE
jgi:CBS domain containing-hemolysin-like protein